MFWVPHAGQIGVGVSVLSYAGGVQFGLITDKKVCAEPQRIIDRFAPEFEKLVLALCMLPWGQPVDADEAPHWLFTTVPGPRSQKRVVPRAGGRRKAASRIAGTTAAKRGNGKNGAAAPGALRQRVEAPPTGHSAAKTPAAPSPVESAASPGT
jgi:hypothetical protein